MDVYATEDYKSVIRTRLKELQGSRKLTLRKLAEKIRIQYTYLSKSLNDAKTHLGEDHLFGLCKALELYPDEIDFLFLLRAHATSDDSARKNYLQGKINQQRKARKLNAQVEETNSRQLTQEMGYLFDPLCVLIHVLLHIDEYFKSPRRICGALGITPTKLTECLRKLSELDFIEMSGGTVKKVMRGHIHYSTAHPLMRVHQTLLRAMSASQLLRAAEDERYNFMVTFSGDRETFDKARDAFQRYLQEIEKSVVSAPSVHAFQMNFDLFQWV